ncbi:hypothetical protein Tco_0127024 [Tanacetum coccineum]
MSDSKDSTVTYTQISSIFADLSDIGSPGVDGPPIMPHDPYAYIVVAYQAPPSLDYIPGPEEPQSPPPLDFVPEPMYPEYMPHEDEILPAEEQPLPAAASPTADSPGYVPKDDDDDEEEEEEHLAPADSVPPVHRMTARISIRDDPSISLPPREEVARQDGPAVAREEPYSVARGDLYGFVNMVDVTPGHPMSKELNYGITDTWDDLVGAIKEIAPTTLEGVNQRVTNLSTTVEQETTIMYDMMEDAQDDRSLLIARVNLLYRDMPVHHRLAVMIEREARMAREAWGLSIDASDYARSDVMSLHTMTQMIEFQRQHGLAKGSAQPNAPGEAGSSS